MGAMSAGAACAVEALLRVAGGEVTVKQRMAGLDGSGMPRQDVALRPCWVRTTGATAELLVSADTVKRAGPAAELFSTAARVVSGNTVWRVVSCSAVECGGTVVAWRVELSR